MARRRGGRHRKSERRKLRIRLRARAAALLALCSASGFAGMAVLAHPHPEIALLAYASAPLAVLEETARETTVPASAVPVQTWIEVRTANKGNRPALAEEEQPRILIYHTHATEAYLPTEENPYTASGNWRTEDREKSVIAVGAYLAELLEQTYGIPVIHDTTDHEPPKLSTAYSRSELTMEAYREKYPSLELYIDVHRDAYGNDITVPTDYLVLDETETARLMFVVGTGKGATGTGFDEMPHYDSNLALAEQITATLNGIHARLAREVRIKTGRYNQHISEHCLLVEVGHNANTLEQALAAVPYLAKGIAEAMESLSLKDTLQPDTAVWLPQNMGE